MRRIEMAACAVILLARGVGAVLLAEETFDYGIGSASSTWNGGSGFVSKSWNKGGTGAILDKGFPFGRMPVTGGAVHIKYSAGLGFSAKTMSRNLDTISVNSGNLWIAYLYRFDTARSIIPEHEFLEVRLGAGNIRTKIDESLSAIGLRYGKFTSISPVLPSVKDGTILLYVAKFPDMGSETGADAKAWVLSSNEYDLMIARGEVSEANLDTYAGLQLSTDFCPNGIMSGNVSMQLVPMGRENSTPSFYLDELRLGTAVQDVISVPKPITP